MIDRIVIEGFAFDQVMRDDEAMEAFMPVSSAAR
jgi:hypothetical protein